MNPKQLEEKFIRFAKSATIVTVSSIFSGMFRTLEDVDVVDLEKLRSVTLSDRGGRGLVTVCNHHSTFDDPGLVSLIIPFRVRAQSQKMRVGVCSEELCFANPLTGTFIGLGNGLPIQRGGSIHQKAIADLGKRLAKGGWVHIFPEGRVWQEGGSPLRDAEGKWCSPSGRCTPPYKKVGPFKWGVGKVIANSETLPVVVPFYHSGMDKVMPQDSNNQLLSTMPSVGKKITVQIGDPIDCAPLVRRYHEEAAKRAAARAANGGRCGATPPDLPVHILSHDATMVPKRTTATGVIVPAYLERPLLIKPPDHATLSPEEALIEEKFRLALYRDVTYLLQDTVCELETKVRQRRREKGLDVDERQW